MSKESLTLLLFLGLLIAFPVGARAPKSAPKEHGVVQQNTFRPVGPVSVPDTTTYTDQRSLFVGLKYKTLIKCLARYESNYRTDVWGDSGRAFGILQFHQPTFDRYCEGSRSNPRDQVKCADEMLQTNFNNVSHWTTAKYCLP